MSENYRTLNTVDLLIFRFLIRFDEIANLQKELSAFLSKQICTEQQMCLVIKALENAYEQKRKEIKNLLSQQGILQV
jgi:hypothetical protein